MTLRAAPGFAVTGRAEDTAAPWIEAEDFRFPGGWTEASRERAAWYCEQLEQNQILLFRQPPFELPEADREFLISRRQAHSRLHKNVSYRPETRKLRGAEGDAATQQSMHRILREFSAQATRFVAQFLWPYGDRLVLDYASFRPLEEEGRELPLHKRNDLLHVDAFPSRPTRGARILRVFVNIHTSKPRTWTTTDRFPALAERFAGEAGLAEIAARHPSTLRKGIHRLLRRPDRSPYDEFMLRFHDFLKENAAFQAACPKVRVEFPPMSTWLVYTDGVPHAVLSGQFALEHTYIVPADALVAPRFAPIRVLESLCGRALA